LRKVGN